MTTRRIIFIFFIGTNIIHSVSSGCILHTFGDSSTIACQEISSLENLKPLKTQGVTIVNISHSEIPLLPSDSFQGFRELRRIHLSGIFVEEVEYGVFSSESYETMLPFLMLVDLSENNIKVLPSEIFNHSNMLELNLASNALKEVEMGAFRNVPKLKKLDLSFNEVSSPDEENTLPLGIFQDVPTLNQLNLSYNSLKTIRIGSFSLLPYLIILDLSHNDLTHLPAGIFTGSAIQELYLNDNQLAFFEYPNARNIHAVINLLNNDFECNFLAETINKMSNAFFTKGGEVTEPNIYGIVCKEEDANDEDGDEEDETLGQIYVLKYLSIATLGLGLILACYVFFCQRNGDESENDDPVLKEVSPLHQD